MKKISASTLIVLIFYALTLAFFSCKPEKPSNLAGESLIPKPVTTENGKGWFELRQNASVYVTPGSEELVKSGTYLAEKLRPSTGFKVEVKTSEQEPGPGNIYMTLDGNHDKLGDEGYELTITKKLVTLSASGPAGIFRGIQTIRQLLPPNIELGTRQEGPWLIAAGKITDYPAYTFRGSMLDVARHFFGVEDVKRYIDLIAYYKMNALHLHLSDDQGWRIEIKSWPNLTAHGGSTEVGGGEGGFYTQEQYSELVKYAADRYIIIIPEIDMPGHINAALSSYAELNIKGKATDLYTGIEVGFSTIDTKKETSYKFIDDVVRELAAITPGPYIHIGGDESHVTRKEDYIPFVRRVQEIVRAHGKQVMGWDEISLSELAPNTVAQFWSNAENAGRAVSQGAKILMSPAARTYIDMKYDSTTVLGQHWAGYVEVDSSYIWDPATLVPGIKKENILGVEAPLWTETISKMDELEYMVFPRLPGIAEVGWSPAAARTWSEYKVRLGKHADRFTVMNIDYYASKLVPWQKGS